LLQHPQLIQAGGLNGVREAGTAWLPLVSTAFVHTAATGSSAVALQLYPSPSASPQNRFYTCQGTHAQFRGLWDSS